ncbi:lipoprotein [Mycoplasma feriruminatoris]|uniref:MAG6410 family transglutaminase-related lipoprotein n=1 Tax=Mycoplasma feriruminatoris TaxID=1179777 RepID=UPI00241F6999|nr:transglutaminase domain-containing protein [Mycoplasma feriruminatoris]WFQ96036.1 lipoprotein [Mycoplasma feriruminatoris]
MKKLQSYLKLLSIGSVIVLAGTTISCSNINNSATRNFVIPTVNRRPNNSSNESNRNEDSRNNTTPENTQPVNNNNQGSNHNSNNSYSNNEVTIPTNNNPNNGQAFYSSISYLNHNLTELENKYIDFENKSFTPLETDTNNVKDIILNSKLPTNFYSHPRYKLNKQNIVLDQASNNQVQLKLFDTVKNEEISNDQVKWYQRITYPNDEILEANHDQSKGTFILSDNGTLKWKDTRDNENQREVEEKSARIWANYKGYLYSTVVRVYSKERSKILSNENEARKMAKKIVEDNNWKKLPPLEKLIKAYEWMTKEVKYDYNNRSGELLRSQNAYSALVERNTVCTGYAKGFKMIMDELEIPCKFMEGDSNREDSFISKHAWNLVQIDDEWYHVDPTSDRVEKKKEKTDFNFFLNTNKDFVETDTFYRDFSNQGSKLRNLKFKNFVLTEDDVLDLIDNSFDIKTNQLNRLELTTNSKNFGTVNKAFSKMNLDVKESKFTSFREPNKSAYYLFEKQKEIPITNVKVTNIEQYKEKKAIKIDFDRNITDLRIGNFNIKNAFVEKIEKIDNSYILYLDHFSSFGQVEVKIESIKKKDYKFELNNKDKIQFNINKQQEPNISIQTLDDKTIKIVGDSNNLEYNFNNNSWKDVPINSIITDATIGNLYVRHKGNKDKLSSDSKLFEITKYSEVNDKVKLINGNILIGVDKTMEYKKEKDKNWTPITETVLKNLPKDSYLIRAKANETTLASDISKVEIR